MAFPATIVASRLAPNRYRQQPQSGAQIDWSHPLARGLVFFQIPNAQASPELVGGAVPGVMGGTVLDTGAGGRALSTTSTTTDGWGTPYAMDKFRTITTEFTIATRVDIAAVTSNSKLVTAPLSSNAWNAPYIAFNLGRSSTSSQAVLQMSQPSPSTSTMTAFFPATTFQVGNNANYVATRSGTTCKLLFNGTYHSTASSTMTADPVRWDTSGRVALMNHNYGSPGEGTAGKMYYTAIWNRALSEAEARSFQANPYQVLKPIARPSVFAFSPDVIFFPGTSTAQTPKFGTTASGTNIAARTATATGTWPKFGQTATATRTIPARTAASAATLPKFGALAAAVRLPPAITAASAATLRAFGSIAAAFGAVPGFVANGGTTRLPKFGGLATATRTIPARIATSGSGLPRFSGLAAATFSIAPHTATSAATWPKFGTLGIGLRTSIDRSATALAALPRLGALAAAVRLPPLRTATAVALLPRFGALAQGARSVETRTSASASGLPRLRASADAISVPPPGTVVPLTVGHKRAPSWRLADAGTGQGTLAFGSALDPNGLTYFTVDWTQELNGSTDTIWLDKDAIGAELATSAVAAGLLIHAITFDATSITVWLRVEADQQNAAHWSGAGEIYPMNFRVKTTNGQVLNRAVRLSIKQL